jgi:pimeloyl-ACP methyl ester carboxylesterase
MGSVETPSAASGRDAYGPVGRSEWLDVDWREHQRWVRVLGTPVNVVELGSGDPIVFIHGLSGSWQNWLENLPHFARNHRVVAFDLPGFGASPMPADRISIAGYARIVDALLGELGIDAACVVGNSMGGFIAAELAITVPERVERLVLVSAAGISSQQLRSTRGLSALRLAENVLTMYGGWLASRSELVARRGRLRRTTFSIVARHPELIPAPLVAEQLKGSGKPGFVDALDALTDYPIEDRLGQIACPTLIVWGTHDHLVPLRDADRFAAAIPGSRKLVYADTGHVSMLERPARFNADVDAFLADDAGERVGERSLGDAAEAEAERTGDPAAAAAGDDDESPA